MNLTITFLGQVCILIQYNGINILIDPYFSNRVGDEYGEEFNRQVPSVKVSEIKPDVICVTHDHEDHCDPVTLKNIEGNFPNAILVCDKSSSGILKSQHIFEKNMIVPKVSEVFNFKDVEISCIPSAHLHLEIDKEGYSRFNGYIIKLNDFIIYHPGDTIPHQDIYKHLPKNIDLAFLPINERNYFRESNNIIGNMTCREAIQFADTINAKNWVPTHWDMFMGNSVDKEEFDVAARVLECQNSIWLNFKDTLEYQI